MISISAQWGQRDQVVQTLYIPPSLQILAPHVLIGDELPEGLLAVIQEHDLARLNNSMELFCRGAATRFFNLPSARRAIETALRSELDAVNSWLTNERTIRFAFDYFGTQADPCIGYGILKRDPSAVLFTRILRIVLQRDASNTYVLWTAFPLLSPRNACWPESYDYKSHAPSSRLARIFYDFLNNYLSVNSDCVLVDAVVQGTTDFWHYEAPQTLIDLHQTVRSLNAKSLNSADSSHLQYELSVRCLDETLPPLYLEKPNLFVEALQNCLTAVINVPRPD